MRGGTTESCERGRRGLRWFAFDGELPGLAMNESSFSDAERSTLGSTVRCFSGQLFLWFDRERERFDCGCASLVNIDWSVSDWGAEMGGDVSLWSLLEREAGLE